MSSLTKKQEREYLKNGDGCPFCKSTNVEGDGSETGGGEASQGVTCLECGAHWTDIYKLHRIVVMDEPEGGE